VTNSPHLHLLLNHAPTVGTVAALCLLLLAFARRNDHLKHAALEVLFLVSLLTLPVYVTGVAAEAQIESLPGVSVRAAERHQDAALVAFVCMQVTGLLAWIGLWQFRRLAQPAAGVMGAVVLLGVMTVALMARAATPGGEIRHPEIRAVEAESVAEPAAETRAGFGSASVALFVTKYAWVWPAAETLHFLGLCLVFGVVLAVNLRILGAMKGRSRRCTVCSHGACSGSA